MKAPLEASVVIALNPHDNDLDRVLDGYSQQTAAVESFEIVLVNGGARQGVANALARVGAMSAPAVRLIEVEGRGRAAANNAGARASRSDLLLFMADDFIPWPTLVRAHVEFQHSLGSTDAAGIGPAYYSDALRDDPFRRWLEDSGRLFVVPFRIAEMSWPKGFFYVGNASISRRLYEALGAFDETFRYDLGDDFDFSLRMARTGVCSHFLAKAAAWHDHAVTLEERLEAVWRSGEAARRASDRHGAAPEWQAITSRPPAALIDAVREAERRKRMAPTRANEAARYQALLDLAFAQGYHQPGAAAAEGFDGL